MELHKLLRRQLNRLKLNEAYLPTDKDLWVEFITRINKSYMDSDNDRYLIERSMNISSTEMMNLNEKLERAQHIAGLGYWHYDENGQFYWAKELYTIFDYDPVKPPPSYQEFLQLVHKDDQENFQKLMVETKTNFHAYSGEIRIKNPKGIYRWYRMISQKEKEKNRITGIFFDIHKEKETDEKINALNQQLLVTARQAGMSEIATSILHNVGNILNSSSVSINILISEFSKPYHQNLLKVFSMLKENAKNLKKYLTIDAKGKLIPEYLVKLGDVFTGEYEKINLELENIFNDLKHIKDIVSMQQSISGMSGFSEKVFIPETIETAINISLNKKERESILINKKYLTKKFIYTDKSKLLQILINLIRNAKDAVINHSQGLPKEIEIILKEALDGINIVITDNGVGIPPENLDRIFSFGFTTKETGHGFGLHSSALSAREMGGVLQVKSEGLKKGASFILMLPSSTTKVLKE